MDVKVIANNLGFIFFNAEHLAAVRLLEISRKTTTESTVGGAVQHSCSCSAPWLLSSSPAVAQEAHLVLNASLTLVLLRHRFFGVLTAGGLGGG